MPTYDYHRLIAMRECLRQVQKLLPKDANERGRSQFICSQLDRVTCDAQARMDTRHYVMASIAPHFTFEGCLNDLNHGRDFGSVEIMQLRQQFIDSLCAKLNQEIAKASYHPVPYLKKVTP